MFCPCSIWVSVARLSEKFWADTKGAWRHSARPARAASPLRLQYGSTFALIMRREYVTSVEELGVPRTDWCLVRFNLGLVLAPFPGLWIQSMDEFGFFPGVWAVLSPSPFAAVFLAMPPHTTVFIQALHEDWHHCLMI